MRRFVLLLSLMFVVLIAVGAGTALGALWTDAAHGATISIDGQQVEGPLIVAGIGAIGGLVAAIVCLVVVLALASVAVIVPLAIALALCAALVGIVVGLSPIVVPVLLVVGACALLSRRSKRRESANAAPAAMQMPNTPIS